MPRSESPGKNAGIIRCINEAPAMSHVIGGIKAQYQQHQELLCPSVLEV